MIMQEDNKKRMKQGFKMLLLVIWLVLSIATCAGIWNVAFSTLLSVCAGGMLIGNFWAIVKIYKEINKSIFRE